MPLLFNLALEYASRKTHQNHVKLKINETPHFLAYVDNMNLLEIT
jgi:hypothetical protein